MTGNETAVPGRVREDAGGRGAVHLPAETASTPRGLKPPGSSPSGGRAFRPGVAATSRVAVFALVGIIGYGVQTLVLWLLVGRLGMAVVPATLAATEAAVLHNFLCHLGWTWADRPAGPGSIGRRLLRFNLSTGGFSLAGGAALMALLVDALGMHYLLANLMAVIVVSVANFLASDRFVFTRDGAAGASGSRQTTYKITAM